MKKFGSARAKEQQNKNNQTLQSSPKSTSTYDTETSKPSKPYVSLEEGHKKDTSEDSLDDIVLKVCIRNSVYDI